MKSSTQKRKIKQQRIEQLAADYDLDVDEVKPIFNKAERKGLDVHALLEEHLAELDWIYDH